MEELVGNVKVREELVGSLRGIVRAKELVRE